MKKTFVYIFVSLLLFISCKKDDTDCNSAMVQKAAVENDKELMRAEINKVCAGIPVVRTSEDLDGLKNSLNKLVEKINTACGTQAAVVCYFCIDTLPSQAEIKITAGSITRIIDISYDSNKKLVFVNMHD